MTRERLIPAAIIAASAAVLTTAFVAEHIGGVRPCVLCIYQRYPYAIAIALAALALAAAGRGRAASVLVGTCGATFLAGAGLALYHVGVEQHWIAATTSCGGDITSPATVEELRAAILAAPLVRCDEVPWSLFGVSLAGYNAAVSLALAAACVVAARRLGRTEGSWTRTRPQGSTG